MKWFSALFLFLFSGCLNSPVAFRSVVHNSYIKSSTDGKVDYKPTERDAQVNAEKTTQDAFKIPTETVK